MLKRSIDKKLAAWKARPHHPLVLSGLRQTGKTFSVRAFGRASYGNVVYLDLRANKALRAAFSGDFDVDKMVLSITANMPGARFVPNDTLLILDEIGRGRCAQLAEILGPRWPLRRYRNRELPGCERLPRALPAWHSGGV